MIEYRRYRVNMKLIHTFLWIISSLQKIERRVANPIFRVILRSRFYWIVSGRLTLISYVGRRSGQRYTFPVAYHPLDGAVVAVTPKEETNWWRNFQHARECRVWLRGKEYNATGTVVTGEECDTLLAGYVDSHGVLGRILGVDPIPEEQSQSGESDHGLAVVRFAINR